MERESKHTDGSDHLDQCPVLLGGHERAREDDPVERHVVLCHELVQLHILIVPPLLPLVSVVRRDRDVSEFECGREWVRDGGSSTGLRDHLHGLKQ